MGPITATGALSLVLCVLIKLRLSDCLAVASRINFSSAGRPLNIKMSLQSVHRGAGRGGQQGYVPPTLTEVGQWPPTNFVPYTTKFLESFHQRPPTSVRMHHIRFAPGLRPGPCCGAHIQESRLRPSIAISWPMDIWLPKLIFYNINMFAKF